MSFKLSAQAFKIKNNWLNQNIKVSSSTAKFIFFKLCDNSNDEGNCFPSIKTIAEDCACSERTVQRALRDFEDYGLISIEPRKRKNGSDSSNEYQINLKIFDEITYHNPRQCDTTTPVSVSPQPRQRDTPITYHINRKESKDSNILSSQAEDCANSSPKKRNKNEYSEEFLLLWNNEKTPKFARDGSKPTAYSRWNKITKNGKDIKKKAEITAGWLRHVAQREEMGINVKQLDTFLNIKEEWWKKEWEKPEPKKKFEKKPEQNRLIPIKEENELVEPEDLIEIIEEIYSKEEDVLEHLKARKYKTIGS